MDKIGRATKLDILAIVDRLADEAGDWQDHLPYEALLEYYKCDDVRKDYGAHASSCRYCQELVSIFS